jgi:Domain of unknown function (DUF4124)
MLRIFGVHKFAWAGALLALVLLVSPLAAAQVYQWEDEQGNVHFGDAPPEGVNAKAVDLPPGPSDQEVESAQRKLEDALNAREKDNTVNSGATVPEHPARANQPVPEFACYTAIEQVLQGPTKAAYVPASPTAISDAQRRGARAVLSSASGQWRGTALELNCSGQIDAAKSEHIYFDVTSVGIWRKDEGLLALENKATGSRRRVNETRVSYIQIDDAVYFREAKGDGTLNMGRTMELRGNQAEGLYLDENSLAFMSTARSYNVMRTEIRHLRVSGRTLEYTELYFHSNILTGSRVWTLSR